jgi:hypothetical protein
MSATRVASARQVFLDRRPGSLDEQVQLENSFFRNVRLSNGTHKTTAPGRLTDVDEVIGQHVEDRESVHLLDVGISSGVTTLELLESLERKGIRVSGVGVDICVRAFFRSFLGIDVLYDSEGTVLQVATPFFARGRPHRSQKSLQSRVLGFGLHLLETALVRRWTADSRRSLPLNLISPRLLKRSDFKIVEHDVGLPMPAWESSFNLIRAANVLNLDYFSPAQIVLMVKNLTTWLKTGGVLAICRTNGDDGSNHGTLYCKPAGSSRLERLRHIGKGYELDPLIAASFSGEEGA